MGDAESERKKQLKFLLISEHFVELRKFNEVINFDRSGKVYWPGLGSKLLGGLESEILRDTNIDSVVTESEIPLLFIFYLRSTKLR